MAKRGTLHFTIRRELQATAMKRFAGRELAQLETTRGKSPPRSVVEFLKRNRRQLAAFRKISRNNGKRLVDRTQRKQRALDLIDTGLMISSWKSTLVDESNNGLVADVRLTNAAPYAGFVHPKRSKKLFRTHYLPPIVKQAASELGEDQAEFIGAIGEAVVADAARSAFIDSKLAGKG